MQVHGTDMKADAGVDMEVANQNADSGKQAE